MKSLLNSVRDVLYTVEAKRASLTAVSHCQPSRVVNDDGAKRSGANGVSEVGDHGNQGRRKERSEGGDIREGRCYVASKRRERDWPLEENWRGRSRSVGTWAPQRGPGEKRDHRCGRDEARPCNVVRSVVSWRGEQDSLLRFLPPSRSLLSSVSGSCASRCFRKLEIVQNLFFEDLEKNYVYINIYRYDLPKRGGSDRIFSSCGTNVIYSSTVHSWERTRESSRVSPSLSHFFSLFFSSRGRNGKWYLFQQVKIFYMTLDFSWQKSRSLMNA